MKNEIKKIRWTHGDDGPFYLNGYVGKTLVARIESADFFVGLKGDCVLQFSYFKGGGLVGTLAECKQRVIDGHKANGCKPVRDESDDIRNLAAALVGRYMG